jgi:hypothetical protein
MINITSIENPNNDVQDLDNNIIQEEQEEQEEYTTNNIEDEQEEQCDEEKYTIDRRRKILILQFYINEFPRKLAMYVEHDLEQMTNEELGKLRNEFDFIIGCKNTVNITTKAFQHSICALEGLCVNYTPLKVNGLSLMCNDEELMDDVKHWALQNMSMIRTKPEHRILFKVVSTMSALHTLNSSNQNQEQYNNYNNNNNNYDDLENEYNDL